MSENESKGERIAKVMARAGISSRRDAEKMIVAGRVSVNGKVISSPALDVLPTDKVALDDVTIDAPQETRLWAYYKPLGLVTSEKDEKGRQTVFDTMPEGMPRVMSVGRLDLNSEGLLLLTNDGELKRRLELPATGWLRKYRVRVNGQPNNNTFDPLRRGLVVEGETFQPMEVVLDRQQGANAWLTVGIREGKNREVRRAMNDIGLMVNRLIRVSYGPFRLNEMKPGDVIEIKRRVLRDQLGGLLTGEDSGPDHARGERPTREYGQDRGGPRERGVGRDVRPERNARPDSGRAQRGDAAVDSGARKPRHGKGAPGDAFERAERTGPRPDRKPYGDAPPRGGKPAQRGEGYAPRGDRPARSADDRPRGGGYGKPAGGAGRDDRPGRPARDKPYGSKDGATSAPRETRAPRSTGSAGDGKPFGGKPRAAGSKPFGDKPRGPGGGKSFGDKPRGPGGAPRSSGPRTGAPKPAGGPRGPKPGGRGKS